MSPELKIMLRREVQQHNIHISWKPTSEIRHDKSPHSFKPTLPPHIQRLAVNVGYLRRSKEEADKDRIARHIEIEEWEERVFDDSDNWVDTRYGAESPT